MSVELICELSGNHNGSLERALKLVDAAAEAGATAVKTQCFFPETLTLDCRSPDFIVQDGIWKDRALIDLYRETATPWTWQEKICDRARELGLRFGASVFCKKSTDVISGLSPDFIKIASLEIVDLPLIEYAASKGYPMILSCGMATDKEIEEAVETCAGDEQLYVPPIVYSPPITLLHCPSGYPAETSAASLQVMEGLEGYFCDFGLSDHSLSTLLPALAIAAGATVIEKHLTLSREDGGPDAAFSLNPREFKEMAYNCRQAEAAMRWSEGGQTEPLHDLRRSLYVVKDISLGEEFTEENVRSIRPGYGLPPKHLPDVLGRLAAVDLAYGTPLEWKHLQPEVRESVGAGRRSLGR